MRSQLVDSQNRAITYLRLSVTDRCNFRCFYCTPMEGLDSLARASYLTPDEMEHFVRAVTDLGVTRLRLTGGEPLLRRDIVSLVARFSTIAGLGDLALTTNGERLGDLAHDLKKAGLHRINVSLDSLDPKRFHKITGSDSFFKVWRGLLAALEAGLQVKINVVAMKDMADEEIDRFAALAFQMPVEVRFIEFMPLCGSNWNPDLVLPIDHIRSRIAAKYPMKRLDRGSEVAESFELEGGKGKVGFIGSMTEPFCSKCSRIRMDATGKIQLCLFSPIQYDLGSFIKAGASIDEIQNKLEALVQHKPAKHPYGDKKKQKAAHGMMRAIGG